ncbi:hypothetical protein DWV00_29360 [Trinickia dinghuensis]|uniref:Uncharacterized protein n=1 Tax=Trinickia dinghuensis TaxID=2291023 RepID=A0A3D8JS22_9BURK|nr:hypothetical protein DWV00_29360 [Trinickia dinghuensis]
MRPAFTPDRIEGQQYAALFYEMGSLLLPIFIGAGHRIAWRASFGATTMPHRARPSAHAHQHDNRRPRPAA